MAGERRSGPEPKESRETSRVPSWVVAIGVLALAGVVSVIVYGYLTKPGWIGVSDKKFWDYLELLIVPAALAIGGYMLNRAQKERERKAEEARRERELEIENQRSQDAALQAYLDQMSQLLLDHGLRQSEEEAEVRALARARTLTILERMNGERKRSVSQFLYESSLIGSFTLVLEESGSMSTEHGERILTLRDVDLSKARLGGVRLLGADLSGANLRDADLSGADLWGVILIGADLSGADLSGAILSDVDLSDAKGVTEEQLDQTKSLERATMPNGQKYEDWLKDKESREKSRK